MENYTQAANSRCFDLFDEDAAAIWNDIENTPEDTDADRWRKKLTGIACEYSFSGRFALMRILMSRARGNSLSAPGEGGENFEYIVDGRRFAFSNVTIQHAENLSPEENVEYETLLLTLAELNGCDTETARGTIRRAWYDVDSIITAAELQLPEEIKADKKLLKAAKKNIMKESRLYKTMLTRSEAFRLGHILNFTLQEMQWFLLRAFDVGEGFCYNCSDDLIEAYGFIMSMDTQRIERIKAAYAELAARQIKQTDVRRNADWTQCIPGSLEAKCAEWKTHPDTCDEEFLLWLGERAAFLDAPSRTALRVYRNLASYACNLVTGDENIPTAEELPGWISDVAGCPEEDDCTRELLYEGESISAAKCKKLADILRQENKIISAGENPDITKLWHVPVVLSDGSISFSGGINASRTRMQDLLQGKAKPEKSDVMYLLWFIANLVWSTEDMPDSNDIFNRLADFTDMAAVCLDAALLPEFYPPHLMEQSMMLAIISGRDEEDPAVVYEFISSALTARRERAEGGQHHGEEEKLAVVKFYIEHKEMTLDKCAEHFGISPKTLSAWQKTLKDAGKI